jgi:hypothetical protein
MKLLDLETMARGSDRQKKAYEALRKLELFEKLKDYSPVLAGTVPIGVDIPTSDLDVICSVPNLESFAHELKAQFGDHEGFDLHHKLFRSQPAVVARFQAYGEKIEIFAQGASVFTQNAVIHMLIEARLLTFAPAEAKEKIRQLKLTGMKTEPAFAAAFDIKGDAFEELLKIAHMPDHEILMIAHRFRFMQQ